MAGVEAAPHYVAYIPVAIPPQYVIHRTKAGPPRRLVLLRIFTGFSVLVPMIMTFVLYRSFPLDLFIFKMHRCAFLGLD